MEGDSETVTIVGTFLCPRPGEQLLMEGAWVEHPKFGRQFRVVKHKSRVPSTVQGILRYLGSGFIKGIGPVMASRIVKKFGDRTLEVIDAQIEELLKVEGIGLKRLEMIAMGWQEHREIRDLMIFLHEYGISPTYAARIHRRYGDRTIAILEQNPYRLATEIHGIGFRKADEIAQSLGFEMSAPFRVEAGILYVLQQLAEDGHVYYPYEPLIEKCRDMLGTRSEAVAQAIGGLAYSEKLVIEDLNEGFGTSNNKAVYLKQFHVSERGIAEHFGRLRQTPKEIRKIDLDRAVRWVQGKIQIKLAPRQIEAVKTALSDKLMVLTGGPGTGKTTIIAAIIKIYRELGARIVLAAPTGRASKRMSEATGYPSKTIHRLLEFNLQKGGFQRNRDRPVKADVIILDEVSMIDTFLMHHLVKALPSEATMIMVGDVNQLPSVGPGSVLSDIIRSERVPVAELREIFRQAEESRIVTNAHKINMGLIPDLRSKGEPLEDFYFIEQDDSQKALKLIADLVCERIPRRFHFDRLMDIQVLSPMHRGVLGTENLNRCLQGVLNDNRAELVRGDRVFRRHDKVMQVKNNYEKEVFNGDIGRITSIDAENQEVVISFEGMAVLYDYSELEEISHAYAISVHKSQGSEYPAVIIPLMMEHYIMLQRNLLYTAVTRGKRLVVIVGNKKALAMAIKNNRIMQRYTRLSERLRGLF
jgi:exodeoxyribonuclease V alpha subunit